MTSLALLISVRSAHVTQGGLVGMFGEHRWQLEQRSTWQDPEARAAPPPLPASSGRGSSSGSLTAHPGETAAAGTTPCHYCSVAPEDTGSECSGAVDPTDPHQLGSGSGAPTALLTSLLSSSSAGARLAMLAGATAAAKASACSGPVHIQAHSALPLHRLGALPALATRDGRGGGGGSGRGPEAGYR